MMKLNLVTLSTYDQNLHQNLLDTLADRPTIISITTSYSLLGIGNIDVGDACRRQNVLMTVLSTAPPIS